jgi:cytochrome c-type biogenesis protein CcmF
VAGVRARRRAHGEGVAQALGRLIAGNNRRYGGYIAHIGVVVVATGIAGSSAFMREKEATLKPGQTMAMGKYTVRFDGLTGREEPHRFVVGANLSVLRGNREVARLEPKLNYYQTREEPITTPAVRSRVSNDLYINLLAFDQNGAHATLHVLIEPLVSWIWAGGLIVAFGAFLGALPLQRKRRVTPIAREREVVAA